MGRGAAGGRPLGRSRSVSSLRAVSGRPPLPPHKMMMPGGIGTLGGPGIYPGSTGELGSLLRIGGPAERRMGLEGWSEWAAIMVAVILGAVMVAAVWGVMAMQKRVEYAVVMDAGSTGTRVYVYSWLRSLTPGSLPTVRQSSTSQPRPLMGGAYNRMETVPGLHQMVGSSEGVVKALAPLLKWARQQVPHAEHDQTPIFMFGTAGLRKLPQEDSDWVLDQARAVLRGSPFRYRREWVRIISGVEEAVYGWVALNYLMGRLDQLSEQPSLGALDLGGSSLEVTFLPPTALSSADATNISLASSDFHLYARSHSSFGLNDAFDRSISLLVQQGGWSPPGSPTSASLSVPHPCLHQGYSSNYSLPIELQPLIALQGRKFRAGAMAPPSSSSVQVLLVGAPHWSKCRELVDAVVEGQPDSCPTPPCALGAPQQALHGQFVALTGFFVVYHFFNLPLDAPPKRLLEVGEVFCSHKWEAVKDNPRDTKRADRYCFRAPYVVSLLRRGLGLEDGQVRVGPGDIQWTLGAALYERGALKPLPEPRLSRGQRRGHSVSSLYDTSWGGSLPKARSSAGSLPADAPLGAWNLFSSDMLPMLAGMLAVCLLGAVVVIRWLRTKARGAGRRMYGPVWGGQSTQALQALPAAPLQGHQHSQLNTGEWPLKLSHIITRRGSLALEPIPGSPPSIPIKAPSSAGAQSTLAARRSTSKDESVLDIPARAASPGPSMLEERS